MNSFVEEIRLARDVLNKGAFREAFNQISDAIVSRPAELFHKISLMMDAGIALRDTSILEYTRYVMDSHSKDILTVPSLASFFWFNTAILHLNYLHIRESEGAGRFWYNREHTALARTALIQAEQTAGINKLFKAVIFTVHGELLMGLGRNFEAFNFFHQANVLDNQNKDALLGRVETLTAIAGTTPSMEEHLLLEAREQLVTFNQNKEWENSERTVRLMNQIDTCLGSRKNQKPVYPRNTLSAESDQEHFLVMESLKNHLYLTPCGVCHECDYSVGDSVGLGAHHARLGKKAAARYQRMAFLTGRLVERFRALRNAYLNHCREEIVPDCSDFQNHYPEVNGWQPIPPATAALTAMLAGGSSIFEGMISCVAVASGQDESAGLPSVLGTSKNPSEKLKKSENHALHAFWDLWSDGAEGLTEGLDFVNIFNSKLASSQIESISLNRKDLSDRTLEFLLWTKNLISYLVHAADHYEGREIPLPPLWNLQPVKLPED